MNKKLWFTGGEPDINADDLMRNSQANNRAFQNILKAWLIGYNENFIISGCVPTITAGVNISVTEGYIFLNGEIMRVDAQTVAAGLTDFYYYEKAVTYDSNGTKVFNDAVTHETWQKNRGVLINTATKPVPTDKLDAEGDNWSDKLKNKIKGDYIELTPADIILNYEIHHIKADLSGSAATFKITIPNADDQIHETDVIFIYFHETDPNLPRCTYEIRDVDNNLHATINKPSFYIFINDNGVWKIVTFINLDAPVVNHILIEKPATSWNMDTDAIFTAPHGLANKDLIKTVSARIYNDAGDSCFEFASADGLIKWDNTNVILDRATTSIFNSSDFNGTGFDRGIIYIQT